MILNFNYPLISARRLHVHRSGRRLVTPVRRYSISNSLIHFIGHRFWSRGVFARAVASALASHRLSRGISTAALPASALRIRRIVGVLRVLFAYKLSGHWSAVRQIYDIWRKMLTRRECLIAIDATAVKCPNADPLCRARLLSSFRASRSGLQGCAARGLLTTFFLNSEA